MKKILFLLLICIIKLNAYEYVIFSRGVGSGGQDKFVLFIDLNNKLVQRSFKFNDSYYDVPNINLGYLYLIKRSNGAGFGTTGGYITASQFYDYYSNDLIFLNALYTSNKHNLIGFLNYLYNDSYFSTNNFINYEDYQLLYNSEGLIVESIVNGKWAGLYDGPDNSGYLYNEKGDLLYKNGVPVSFLEKINDKLLKRFKINLESIFIKNIFYPLLVLIFACVIFRSVIRMAFKAFLIRFYDKKIGQLEKRREKIENA